MVWTLVGDYFGALMNNKTVLQKNHKERHGFFLKQRNKSAALHKQKLHKQLPSRPTVLPEGKKEYRRNVQQQNCDVLFALLGQKLSH